MDSLKELSERIDAFNKERDWDQFHSPANLAKSISIEANELLECFQWSDDKYNIKYFNDTFKQHNVNLAVFINKYEKLIQEL